MPLWEESTQRLCELLSSGEVTAVQLAEAYLDRIATHDDELGAFLHVDREAVLRQAEASDKRRGSGAPIGHLEGLPIAIKDVVCEKGVPATCASRMLKDFVAPYDAGAISGLRADGAVLLGARTWTSSRWGVRARTLRFRSRVIRGTPRHARWFEWRFCRRGGGATRSAGFGIGYRWLDSSAGCVLWHRGTQADLWTRLAIRVNRLCQFARSDRADGSRCLRHRLDARIAGRT